MSENFLAKLADLNKGVSHPLTQADIDGHENERNERAIFARFVSFAGPKLGPRFFSDREVRNGMEQTTNRKQRNSTGLSTMEGRV